MTTNDYLIKENKPLTTSVYRMVVEGDTTPITAPGQFVNIALEGKFLRRPISICDWDETTITLIYKVVGEGTKQMSEMKEGEKLNLIVGLGNGFNTDIRGVHPLLVGGGVGVPPLYGLAKKLLAEGKKPVLVMGFNTADEAFYFQEFCALGIDVFVSTVDGTGGTKGLVTDAMAQNFVLFDYFYACGPLPMLKSLAQLTTVDGQLSFEERMGCGFGACMGCTIETKNGPKRVCKEGPVLTKNEIIWK